MNEMIDNGIKTRAHLEPFASKVDIVIFKYGYNQETGVRERLVVHPVNFVQHKQYEPLPIAMSIPLDAAQELMDDLWRCGLRPSEGKGSAGQLAAVSYHLEDMRKLVFENLFRKESKQ